MERRNWTDDFTIRRGRSFPAAAPRADKACVLLSRCVHPLR